MFRSINVKPFTPPLVRHLKTFPTPRPEVVIANNSGVIFSHAALKMHPPSAHPNLKIIIPPFWLDEVHHDYDNLNWGQTIRGIPWYARNEFLKIYPDQKCNQLITWKQYKELRSFVINKLKTAGVPVFHGIPHITRLNDQGYSIQVNNDVILLPKDTYFYNIFRQADIKHGYANAPEISHTKIYTLPRTKIPKSMIIAGGGRSTIWLCHHFPSSIFACIKPEVIPYPLLKDEVLPSNLLGFHAEKVGEKKEIHIKRIKDSYDCMLVHSDTDKSKFLGQFYCAIGLVGNLDITSMIPKKDLLVYPYFDNFVWVGPQTIPVGSLMESTLRWAVSTENLIWAFETHSYHENHFMTMLTNYLEEKGIILPLTFFDNLRQTMLNHFNLSTNNKLIPTDDEAIRLYSACYRSASGVNFDADVMKMLEASIKDILEERLVKYDPKPSPPINRI